MSRDNEDRGSVNDSLNDSKVDEQELRKRRFQAEVLGKGGDKDAEIEAKRYKEQEEKKKDKPSPKKKVPVSGKFEGYLRKRISKKGIGNLTDSHMRYYILNLDYQTFQQFNKNPNEKKNQKAKKYVPSDFKSIQVDPDLAKPRKWGYGFKVILQNRYLHLFAHSAFDREIWLRAFLQLLKLIESKYPQCDVNSVI